MPQSTNLIRGSLLIIITTLCFTGMDVQVKYFSVYSTFIVFVWAKYFGQTFFLSILCTVRAPILTMNVVIGINIKKAGIFTKPILKGKFVFK